MDKKPQHQMYADTINSQLDLIERKFMQAKDLVEFAKNWDDENAMFYGFMIQTLANASYMIDSARGNVARLAALANPNEPEDLPF